MNFHINYLIIVLLSIQLMPSNGIDFLSILGIGNKHHNKKENDTQSFSNTNAKNYLEKFGYLRPSQIVQGLTSDFSDVKKSLSDAIKKFQEFTGLQPTGLLDEKTIKKMEEPRCGVFDVQAITSDKEVIYKWEKKKLTYAILSFTSDLQRNEISDAINKAFTMWSEKTELDFVEVSPSDSSADIKIKFGSRNHGDAWPFDGKNGVLAHATMPTSGLLHFDEDETWVYMDAKKIFKNKSTDILPVAIHEIGHILGLSHLKTKDSIMAPFYQKTVDDNGNYVMPTLRFADIQAIQELYKERVYGKPNLEFSETDKFSNSNNRKNYDNTILRFTTQSLSTKGFFESLWNKWMSKNDFTTTPQTRTRENNFDNSNSKSNSFDRDYEFSSSNNNNKFDCLYKIDAITSGPNEVDYLFSGSKIYELHKRSIRKVHSLRILFPNGPIYVEAAYYNKNNNVIVLFQSYQVYVFEYNLSEKKFELSRGFPKRISIFKPVGAMQWIDGRHLLFSKNNEFSMYDEYWNKALNLNLLSDYFPNFPLNIKGGILDGSNIVTLFSISHVFRYDADLKVLIGDRQSIPSYLKC